MTNNFNVVKRTEKGMSGCQNETYSTYVYTIANPGVLESIVDDLRVIRQDHLPTNHAPSSLTMSLTMSLTIC